MSAESKTEHAYIVQREAASGVEPHVRDTNIAVRHVLMDDVAKITALVLAHRSAGTLNVVTGVSTSFHDIAHIIAKQCGVTVKSQPCSGPRPHLLHRFFDITTCLKAFPTFHYTPLAEGLELAKGG